MKITFDWLRDHLTTNSKENVLLEKLTNIGLEVESVENLSADNELFKVAKIIKIEKHPNADRLKVCKVDIGTKVLQIICGAPNIEKGLTSDVLKVFELKKSVNSIVSYGGTSFDNIKKMILSYKKK